MDGGFNMCQGIKCLWVAPKHRGHSEIGYAVKDAKTGELYGYICDNCAPTYIGILERSGALKSKIEYGEVRPIGC